MTSRTSPSSAIRRAAGPSLPGNTGWWTTRPASNSSAQSAFGNEKWAAWSPCRWPISRRPTLKANSPRRPGPASTPGQEVTSSVICPLAVCDFAIDSRVAARLPDTSARDRTARVVLGVDVGGTFTDAVLLAGERLVTGKAPTTPDDQSRGVIAAVEQALDQAG